MGSALAEPMGHHARDSALISTTEECPLYLQVVKTMVQQEGVFALYKGVRPSMVAIAPYIALNYTAFDIFKSLLPDEIQVISHIVNLVQGGFSCWTC